MTAPLETAPLTTDILLQELIAKQLGRGRLRRLWLLFLDDDDRLIAPLTPFGDYPRDPYQQGTTGDLGEVTCSELFGSHLARLMRRNDIAQLVLIWERRGGEALVEADCEWAGRVGHALRQHGGRLRAQFVVHGRGVRQFAPDDLPELIG